LVGLDCGGGDAVERRALELAFSGERSADEDFTLAFAPPTPIVPAASSAEQGGSGRAIDITTGALVGAWRLERLLGAGGMGQVWLASRADGAYRRQVALKLPNAGTHAELFATRFAVERDILAKLTHAHIAQFYDAGVDRGVPYIALEYVAGEPITEYCQRKKLTAREMLPVFVQVLRAVQHAHGHLVVHRDIKPNNVLVNEAGEAKLLDFGIAKLLADTESADGSVPVDAEARFMSARYASPEQAINAPFTTASDVYSLGVLLYVMLTGRSPYSSNAAVETDDMLRRAIGGGLTAPVQAHEPATGLSIDGDLRAIVHKAMSRQPEDRYASAAEFAEDIARYQLRKPVRARPQTAAYVASRFVRRHWFGVSSLALAATSLAVFAGLLYRESEMQRRAKEFLLQALTPTSYYTDGGGVLTHTEMLNRAASGVAERFADQPRTSSEIYQAIGESLFNLGQHADAYAVRVKAQPVIDATFGPQSAEAVRNAGRAAYMQLTLRRFDEFKAAMLDLRARCPSLYTLPLDRCYTYIWLQTQLHSYMGEGQQRHALWQQYDQRITPHVDAKSRWHTILNYWDSGGARQAGDLVAAKARWQKLLALPETQSGARGDHMLALAVAGYMADAGFYDEAAALARDAYAQGERWMGAAFDPRLFYAPGVAASQAAAGADFGVETALREGISRAAAGDSPSADQETTDARAALALWLISRGRYDAARAPLDHALKLHTERSKNYNQYVTQLQLWRTTLTVLAAKDAEARAEAQGSAVAALVRLRAQAEGNADKASLPRIDAILGALDSTAASADAHWQRALDAMQTSHARPGDVATLLRALGSLRRMPPPVDDAVVADMRAYAQKVVRMTELAIKARKAAPQ
jgi:serine/threonine protein kinase